MMDDDKWKAENKVSMDLTCNNRQHDVKMFTLKIKRKNKFTIIKQNEIYSFTYLIFTILNSEYHIAYVYIYLFFMICYRISFLCLHNIIISIR